MSSEVTNHVGGFGFVHLTVTELAELVEHASRLFAGEVTVEESVDPECPAAVYIVLRIALSPPRPPTDEIIGRELLWHRAAARIAPQARGLVRLLVE